MNSDEDLRLVAIGDTRMSKNELWEIAADPIIVSVLIGAVITDRLGENW